MPQGNHTRNLKLPYDFLGRPKNGGYFFYFAVLYPTLPAWTFRAFQSLRRKVSPASISGGWYSWPRGTKYGAKRLLCPQIGGLNRLRGNGSKQPIERGEYDFPWRAEKSLDLRTNHVVNS